MSKILGLSAVALVIFALAMSGCTAQAPEAPKPAGPVTTTGQAALQDPAGPAAIASPEPTFRPATTIVNGKEIPYLYSTARGLKEHPYGFVCTNKDQTWILDHEGLVGIWCER